MQITATLVNLYHVCIREMWLHAHELRMESFSEVVQDGKQLHELSYPNRAEKYREITLEGSKIDFYDPQENVVHEIKRSSRAEQAHIAQVQYYLWLLENIGINGATGLLEYPRTRRKHVVPALTDTDRLRLQEWLTDINAILNGPCPPPLNGAICIRCSYYEFCYAGEGPLRF